jgi:hypothetical protein
MTWPNGAVVPPFVRIDHVLTEARLAVTEIAAKPGFGNDDRYLVPVFAHGISLGEPAGSADIDAEEV